MPPDRTNPRAILIGTLYRLFRDHGYEGVSIGEISAATGLGRSSLYHYFPGGKDDMAAAVINFAKASLNSGVFAALSSEAPLNEKIDAMIAAIDALYQGGNVPCVLAVLNASAPDGPLTDGSALLIREWVDHMTDALAASGVSRKESRKRAVRAMTLLQGGLVTGRALDDRTLFPVMLTAMRQTLLASQGPAR